MESRPSAGRIDLASARFIASAHLRKEWPQPALAEVAFAGRSNVGKSSAVNAITRRRGLAKTSKTPGRTQQIVFFELDSGHRLVDLPGYGFARVPPQVKQHWERLITDYLSNRVPLKALILPVDSRRPPTPLDEQMLNWCQTANLPVHVLLTKSDKLGRSQAAQALAATAKLLRGYPRTTLSLFSALKGDGVEEARAIVTGFLSGGTGDAGERTA